MSPLSAIERISLLLVIERNTAPEPPDHVGDRPPLSRFVLEPSIT
jgi:hypothetical protein